jgi:SpoVK/Ycf46/Vps4 family AAA+-type ATPase
MKIFTSADILDPVVGASEQKLHAAISDHKHQAVIFEQADELFPTVDVGVTGSVQRLVGVALKALDERCFEDGNLSGVEQPPFLMILEVRRADALHGRILRRAKLIHLDDFLDQEAQRRLFARLLRMEAAAVDEFVDLAIQRTGAECERIVREAGVKAVRRAIAAQSGSAAFAKEDFQ